MIIIIPITIIVALFIIVAAIEAMFLLWFFGIISTISGLASVSWGVRLIFSGETTKVSTKCVYICSGITLLGIGIVIFMGLILSW